MMWKIIDNDGVCIATASVEPDSADLALRGWIAFPSDIGEVGDIWNGSNFTSLPKPVEQVKSTALLQLSKKINDTEIRILGRVPKALRVSLAGALELVSYEDEAETFLASAGEQLDALTVSDGE